MPTEVILPNKFADHVDRDTILNYLHVYHLPMITAKGPKRESWQERHYYNAFIDATIYIGRSKNPEGRQLISEFELSEMINKVSQYYQRHSNAGLQHLLFSTPVSPSSMDVEMGESIGDIESLLMESIIESSEECFGLFHLCTRLINEALQPLGFCVNPARLFLAVEKCAEHTLLELTKPFYPEKETTMLLKQGLFKAQVSGDDKNTSSEFNISLMHGIPTV
jgi:hypothetical protein